jgi:hypothetical protein
MEDPRIQRGLRCPLRCGGVNPNPVTATVGVPVTRSLQDVPAVVQLEPSGNSVFQSMTMLVFALASNTGHPISRDLFLQIRRVTRIFPLLLSPTRLTNDEVRLPTRQVRSDCRVITDFFRVTIALLEHITRGDIRVPDGLVRNVGTFGVVNHAVLSLITISRGYPGVYDETIERVFLFTGVVME